MFIDKDRHRAAGFFENLGDLLKILVTGVLHLAKFVQWVVAVLDDQENGINVEPLATESLGSRFCQLDPVPVAKAPAQVVLGRLVVEHADDLDVGLMMEAVLLKAVNHPADDVIGVRPEAEDGVNGGQAELFGRQTVCRSRSVLPGRLLVREKAGGNGRSRAAKKHSARQCA